MTLSLSLYIDNRSLELDAIMKAISIPRDKCAAAEEAAIKNIAKFQREQAKLPSKKTINTQIKARNNTHLFVSKNGHSCVGKFGDMDDLIAHTDSHESIRQSKEGNAAHATQVAPS